ncbi:MAG: hypothetical protein NUW02_00775 [Candidatus Campbellbacteria bacterium]|nr:hypothetical protein [Candidatus Campbellbacteria bacterium]
MSLPLPPDISPMPFLITIGCMVVAGISTKLFLRWCASYLETHDTWLDYGVRSEDVPEFHSDETQDVVL